MLSSNLLLLLGCGIPAFAANKPHIFMVIVDDWGWSEVGYHRDKPTPEIVTPTIDALVKNGVDFNRHYVHMMCTPTRSSFLSGRLPAHVLTQLAGPCDENGAIPRNMTGIAAVLKKGGYATHQVGKWDAGMVTPTHTPKGRGYDTSLNYFSHGNWMYTEAEWLGSYNNRSDVPLPGIIDLWDTDKPASHLNGTAYEEYIFRERMLEILHNHAETAPDTPLFLSYMSKLCHYPLQAPQEYQDKFKFIDQDNRRVYHAMVNFLDDQLANITGTMKELGMWDNTLMIVTSDNGGPVKAFEGPCNTTTAAAGAGDPSKDTGHGTVCDNGEAGANNYPLRGGKYSMFEGGIRVNAFASGGFLPSAVRGTTLNGTIHVTDWYRTFAALAGVDPTDEVAAASGLPPIDSLDVWPMVSGANLTSPRENVGIIVTKNLLVLGKWKYVRSNTNMIEAAWGGEQYPNISTAMDPISNHQFKCPAQGCLFDLVNDMEEHHEVSADYPAVVKMMSSELDKQAATIWGVSHKNDPACKVAANELYGGFYGPWKELN
jgi:arylsulfatase I/J